MQNYIVSLVIVFIVSIGNVPGQSTKNLFFVFLNTNPNKAEINKTEVEELQAAHLSNIEKLHKEGKLLAAGPFEGGGGLFIIHADNLKQAEGFLETDPAIAADRFVLEVFPFAILVGSLCEVKEPYEMVNYQLIRFNNRKDIDYDKDEVQYSNKNFIDELSARSDQLVVFGQFNKASEGVLILDVPDTESAEQIMRNHTDVVNEQITYQIKTLWIAKGTFCE